LNLRQFSDANLLQPFNWLYPGLFQTSLARSRSSQLVLLGSWFCPFGLFRPLFRSWFCELAAGSAPDPLLCDRLSATMAQSVAKPHSGSPAVLARLFESAWASLPESVQSLFSEAGVTMWEDLAGLSSQELFAWLGELPGSECVLGSPDRLHVEELHRLCKGVASKKENSRATDVSSSACLPTSTRTPAPAALPTEHVAKRRCLKAGAPASVGLSPVDLAARLPLADCVVQLVLQAREHSTLFAEVRQAEELRALDTWKLALRDSLAARFEKAGLASAIRAWKQWKCWSFTSFISAPACSLFAPPAFVLAQFLRECSDRGPTVAPQIWHSLQFLARHAGLEQLPLHSTLVVPFSVAAMGHSATQAPCLEPSQVSALLTLAQDVAHPKWALAALVLRVIASCLRFGHTSRAYLVADQSGARLQCWHVTRGKSGKREGFRVAIPTFLAPSCDIMCQLHAHLCDRLGSEVAHEFFVPDVCFTGDSLDAPFSWVPDHMPASRFAGIMRSLLAPSSSSSSPRLTTRSTRRCLASFAQALDISGEDRCALGNWRDNVSAQDMPRRAEPMIVRYSSDRLESSAAIKRLLFAAVGHLCKHKPLAKTAALRLVITYKGDFARYCSESTWGALGDDHVDDIPPPCATSSAQSPAVVQVVAADDESQASDSASDASVVLSAPGALLWVTPSSQAGYLHLAHPSTEDPGLPSFQPRCRYVPLSNPVVGVGLPTSKEVDKPWCPSCLAKMPAEFFVLVST